MRSLSKLSPGAIWVLVFAGACGVAKANDVHIAQNAAGSGNGSSCANALPVTYFNTSGNWTSGAPSGAQIGPGTTVHLCGTITAPAGASGYLMFQGAGTPGNPITLLFEPGASLSAPFWSGPAVNIGSNSYVTVDGGANGTIAATANGTGLANRQNYGEGVAAAHSANESNITVQNLTISNLYVHACSLPISNCTDEGGQDTYGIDVWDVSGLSISSNTISNVKWGIRYSYGPSTYSAVTISNNTISYVDHGVFATPGNGAGTFSTGFNISGNAVMHMEVWDDAADENHHDCFHVNSVAGSSFDGINIYNNSCITDPGVNGNTGIFVSPDSNSMGAVGIFNNVIDSSLSTTHFFANCSIGVGLISNAIIANNTLIQPNVEASGGTNPCVILINNGSGHRVQNNVLVYGAMPEWYTAAGAGSATTIDYNDFFSLPSGGEWQMPTTTFYVSLAQWVTASTFDSRSITGNPRLNATYQPQNGSAAIATGTNLTSLGIRALNFDKAGILRPLSGSWDMGAYQFISGAPNPPTGLTATAE